MKRLISTTTLKNKVVLIIYNINTNVKFWCKIYHPFITLNCGQNITVWFSSNFIVRYPSYISVIKYLLWDLDVAILEHFRFSDIETSISIDIQQRGYKCFISMTDH